VVNCVCSCSKLVRFSIFDECVEKNVLLNKSSLFCGMGFNSLGCDGVGGGDGHTNMVLLGRNKETGKWSELC
jgi:hypothetical protein